MPSNYLAIALLIFGLVQIFSATDVKAQSKADQLRAIERQRLRALVDADMTTASRLHADDFELIDPRGGTHSKEQYLQRIASGDLNYLEWEPGEIRVRLYGKSAVIRYKAHLRVSVKGSAGRPVTFWHTDLYEKRNGQWQIVWAHATQLNDGTSGTNEATIRIPHDQPQKFNADELVQRVDHLVYATPDLDRGIAEIEKLVGVRATLGGKHPGRGTKNAFIALGPNSFLEIVAPDPDQPPPKDPRPFFKGLMESKLVRWFISTRDIGHDRDEAVSKGVPYGEVKRGSRQRPDGVHVSWRFTDPSKPVADGVVPFIIDWGDAPHPSQTAVKGATLISLRAEHPDPRYAKRLMGALGLKLSVKRGDRPALIATIEGPRGRVELK